MYNYFMLVGVVVNEIELREVAEGKKVVRLRLAVRREFQNMNGEYDTDFINITLWDFLAEYCQATVKKGYRIGIKGRVCPKKETQNDQTVYTNELYGDRIIFFGDEKTKEISDKAPSATE